MVSQASNGFDVALRCVEALTDIAKAECLDDRITDNLAAIAIAAMNAQIGKPALRNGEHVTITTTEEPRDASGGLHD